jgi:hypothetical protein
LATFVRGTKSTPALVVYEFELRSLLRSPTTALVPVTNTLEEEIAIWPVSSPAMLEISRVKALELLSTTSNTSPSGPSRVG